MASNSEANSLIWPDIELVQDFTPVLVICMFDEDPIKNEWAITLKFFLALKGVTQVNKRIWPELELVPNLMLVPVTSKSDEDLNKYRSNFGEIDVAPAKNDK